MATQFSYGLMTSIEELKDINGYSGALNVTEVECCEFIQACSKMRRGINNSYENMCEELADILVSALQLREAVGANTIDEIMKRKVNRQLLRFKEGKIPDDILKLVKEELDEDDSANNSLGMMK